jgi:two-component system NtrC family sensor kinase
MRDLASKTKLIAALAAVTLLVVVGIFNLRDRLSLKPLPEDGIRWVDTGNGIQAKEIDPDSSLALMAKRGDYLRYIYFHGKYEQVKRAEDADRYLDKIGVGNQARYVIEHQDDALQNIYQLAQPLYDFDFEVRTPPKDLSRGLYMALIGLVYLGIGLFVLFKQNKAQLTYHFLAWFLASFVVYFYSSTLEFNLFDKTVDFLDASALAVLAPLFLHFCARFPYKRDFRIARKPLIILAYVPAGILVGVEALYHYWPVTFPGSSLRTVRNVLDEVELIQCGLFFLGGSALIVGSFLRARTPILRQQLKWIVWGLALSVLPLAVLYGVPYVWDVEITPAMETLAMGPLILIPLSFGYSIVRYRLMDVDVIVRRSFVHMTAVIAVGAIYMAILLGVSDLVKFIWATADLNSWRTRAVVVAGMLIVAMLFAPIKNRMQIWADRWFYGERYNLRTGLQDFGRMLAQTTALPNLLDSVVRWLSEVLSVRSVAIFVEDADSPSGFRLAHSLGLDREVDLPRNIKDIIRTRSMGRGFISIQDLEPARTGQFAAVREFVGAGVQRAAGLLTRVDFAPEYEFPGEHQPENLYYYVPCVVRDRMVATIGLGRPSSGALLTSEDTDLLRALSGYVAVAVDNSLLHRSEMEKAEELARLKEFSENIIESVSVGIMAVDLAGRITTWNTAMEQMFGIKRDSALYCNIEDVLDADLLETITKISGQQGWAIRHQHQVYKYALVSDDGARLTLNISLAPFEAALGVVTGSLMVFENVTERVVLEQQLQEREKLSSIGLLAAGVAHEVNTPLAGISSYSQMLLQQTGDADPKHQLLEKILAQTRRASDIVSNLLNFSRTGNAEFKELDLNKVLEDTLQLLEPQIRNTRIDVIRNYSEDLAHAYGDPSKLQQVFMNMVLNARDAMPIGGKLVIQTRSVETSVVVDFKDSGIGIAPENIARIYDPFFTTKEVGQGTGLGLSLSYGIIQEHGGRILVESRPGEGTHFTIKLPSAQARQLQIASD